MTQFTLSIPFTIPIGMPKEILKTNIKYLLTTIHSFYRSGNEQNCVVWTNSTLIKASVERYAHRSGNPVKVEFEDFKRYGWSPSQGNSLRVSNRLTQFMGTHILFADQPFLHSETDIIYLDKIDTPKTNFQFWGKTWQKKADINGLSSECDTFFNSVGVDIPRNPVWANTGVYYCNTDLSNYAKEVGTLLLTTDISSIVTNKPSEELFQNLALWRGIQGNIDFEADMNLVPNRIEDSPISVRLQSLHYTHGNRPHNIHVGNDAIIDTGDGSLVSEPMPSMEIIALWHFLCAEVDELLGGTLGSNHKSKELYPLIKKYLGEEE